MFTKLKNFFKMSARLGFLSLIEFYKLKYFLKNDNTFRTLKLRNGLVVTVNKNAGDLTTFFEIFINEDYKFGDCFSDGINILDIGANVGYFSLYIAIKFPKAVIFAFEPFPDTFKRLKGHIEINKLTNIKAYNYAVADFNGSSKFYSFDASGCNTLLEGNYDDGFYKTTIVECISFDGLSKLINAVKFEFAKIDCEGSEYTIFLNSSAQAINSVNKYIMEVHNSVKYSRNDLINRFENLKFKVTNFENLLIAEKNNLD